MLDKILGTKTVMFAYFLLLYTTALAYLMPPYGRQPSHSSPLHEPSLGHTYPDHYGWDQNYDDPLHLGCC